MTILQFVQSQVEPDKYYASRFPKWNPTYKFNVYCPWHEEEGKNKPSLAVSLRNGGARCHGCNKSIGNIVHFESELKEIPESEAAKNLYEEFIRPLYPTVKVKKYFANLQFNPSSLAKLGSDLGLNLGTISTFHLGWDYESCRLIIPIPTRFGSWGNVRLYRLPSDRSDKDKSPKIYNAKGYGSVDLYPWNKIKSYDPAKPLVWMKAERDTLLGIQLGLQCFCITGAGESAKLDTWIEELKDFEIYICGDNDKQGVKFAIERLESIAEHCKFAKSITLPFNKTRGKDFSDWILDQEGTVEDFEELLDNTIEAKVSNRDNSTNGSKPFIHLGELKTNSTIRNQTVKTKGIIIGKLEKNYSIPSKFKVTYKNSPSKLVEIPISRELLWLIRSNDDEIKQFIQKKVLKEKDIKSIEATEYLTATEVEIAPIIDLTTQGSYITYFAVFIGEHCETNTPYEFEIIPTSSIKTQEQIGIVIKATPISAALDSYVLQPKVLNTLKVFQSDNDPHSDLCNFADEIASCFTRIYNRQDWHIVALLTYLSPLYFNFPYEGIQRGWLNSLVIGDTQTGKSQVAHSLQRIFGCGTIVNAENCTFVGLVGGTVKSSSGQFMLRWGRIPINDRQMVIIEELSGLSTAEISRMSDVRSSGIARIDKGGITAETTARTRLLALTNVRGSGKALASYPSGLTAISELIGQAEDVSRFDLICTLEDADVSADTINSRGMNFDTIGAYSEESLQNLVRFIWCLKPEQINFTNKAYEACLQICKAMAKVYHPSIPIFKAGSGRLKLARLACAIACAQFNWKKNQIEVTDEHVDCAARVLEMTYDKSSMGYLIYSKKQFNKDAIKNEPELEKVFAICFKKPETRYRVIRYLLSHGKFDERELQSVSNTDQISIQRFIGIGIDSNILERRAKNWEVTSVGKGWMNRYES